MFWLALNTTARPRVEPKVSGHCKLDRALIEPDRVSVIHAYTRPLEHENVDVRGRVRDKLSYERCLPAMSAEVTRVEEAPTARLDQKRIRVEGAVVDKVRRDRERPEREAAHDPRDGRHLSAWRPDGEKNVAASRIAVAAFPA